MGKNERNDQIKYKDIYLLPFCYWNYYIEKYTKKYDCSYWLLLYIRTNTPKNAKNIFFYNYGNIKKKDDRYQYYSYKKGFIWWNKVNNFTFSVIQNK